MAESWPAGGGQGSSPRHPLPPAPGPTQSQPQAQSRDASGGPPRIGPPRRFSMTNYPNLSVDPHTGKWFPEHKWSSAHDLLYAKLCYSNLLFRSPRKSNYIISKGKQWFVDWGTGRMVRVLPPTYGEVDYFGPWQVIHTENFRI
ncbi:PH domain-containing protein [Ophiocordyceps sinensis CO18]|nr:PH domain-containing protein [Ophiocordyceps sinensis CO18]